MKRGFRSKSNRNKSNTCWAESFSAGFCT